MAKITAANAYDVFVEASAAAQAAVAATTPAPMVVGTSKSFFGPGADEIDYTKKVYYVADGLCGRASVKIRPARGAFVSFLKKRGVGRSAYGGGYSVASWEFGAARSSQSYELAVAGAEAAAKVLSSYGLNVYVESSLD